MSISSALSSAFSGLTASSRLAEVASDNISNALTEGFARRQANLAGRLVGGSGMGVRIVSVERQVNQGLVQDLRLAGASAAYAEPKVAFLKNMESAYGDPSDSSSLMARLADLERAAIAAAARPESEAGLRATVDSAKRFADGLNAAAKTAAAARQTADSAIARDVTVLNATLQSVRTLNIQITRLSARGQDVSVALDQRQKLVDQIGEILPVKEVAREGQQIALFSVSGITLLDGRATTFDFTPTAAITPDLSLENGGLSGLAADGHPISTSTLTGRLGEGRLAAQFNLRDRLSPQAQERLDILARNLVERLSGPEADSTLAPNEAGLFIDPLGPLDPLSPGGLASRISVNPLVDPVAGGQPGRLRDGLNSTTVSDLADPARLQALVRQLSVPQSVAAASLQSTGGLADLLSEAASRSATERLSSETELSFAAARGAALKSELLKDGVDTDKEMQDLLVIEKAYAANAKMIQAIDSMLQTVLEI